MIEITDYRSNWDGDISIYSKCVVCYHESTNTAEGLVLDRVEADGLETLDSEEVFIFNRWYTVRPDDEEPGKFTFIP